MSPSRDTPAAAWTVVRPAIAPSRLPAHRPARVGWLMGYVDPIGVQPGQTLRVHLNAPAAHRISVARLGRRALLLDEPDDTADRRDAEVLAVLDQPSSQLHHIHPGSYGLVDGPPLVRPATIAAWVRPWRLPGRIETWNWVAVASDFDFPERCNWALGLTDDGRPACYFGGGPHDRACWTIATESVTSRMGEWLHMACTVRDEVVTLYVDGVATTRGSTTVTDAAMVEPGTVRLAASAESGVIDHLLDADVSDVTLFSRPLSRLEIAALTENRTLGPEVGADAVVARWRLRETSGAGLVDASGARHHATTINSPALGIPGPSAASSIGRAGYDPDRDPTRGGAVRFASDDLIDCGWPAAGEVVVPGDAESGTYCIRVQLVGSPDEEALEMPFVVVRPLPRRARSVALLYATFTWAAYARRPVDDGAIPALSSSCYTRKLNGRMHYHVGLRMPLPRALPFVHRTHLLASKLHQHIVRPERLAEAWLAAEGYSYECITDVELHSDPELLDRFAALMIVGHNEYWSQEMRDNVESYLARDGNVACLSGNTALWRVTYDEVARSLECRKTSHPGEGDTWLAPDEWGERWHADGKPGGDWSYLGQAPSQLLGLETMGWVDTGEVDAFAPFTVLDSDHFLFHEPERVPLEADSRLGTRSHDGPPVSGYEPDGRPDARGIPALPSEGLAHLAHAQHGPNDFIEHWGDDPGYGSDLIYWERPTGGRVFNGANTNYTGAMAVDPGIQALTRNVLHHFGVDRR